MSNFFSVINTRCFTAGIIIICLAMLISSCGQLKMVTHTESGADNYCIYKITDVKKTGNTRPLKIGDIICLYCPKDFHCLEANHRWVKVYTGNYTSGKISLLNDPGIIYHLDADVGDAPCTTCPGSNKFELFY